MSTVSGSLARVCARSARGMLATLVVALGACGGSDDDGPTGSRAVDKVSVDPAEAIIVSGKTVTLAAKTLDVSGQQVNGSGIQWSTDNASIATVANGGVVTAVATGSTRINATANSRAGFSIVSVVPGPIQQTVSSGGATVATPGGEVKVTVPGGALPAGGSVTIEPITTGTAPGTTVPGTVYKIGVFGISVGPRPTITVRYSIAGLPPNFDETKLTLSRKVGVFWIPLPSTVNTTEKTITATVPAGYVGSAASMALAQASMASMVDEEITVGSALFVFETDVTSLQMTVGDRRRVTGRVRSLATGSVTSLTSANVSSSASGVAGTSSAAIVSGTEMSAEVVATAQGTATLTFSAAISSGGATESFAALIPVTVAPQASLAVNIAGLPGGANADVTVTGPSSFSQKITASQTFPNVVPGTYTIAAASVSSNGQTYQASQATQTIAVAAGQSQTATVTYGPTLGTLAITVTGLSGTDAAITVTGPSNFSRTVTSTTTLGSIAPGTYAINAANVNVSGQLFSPAPPSQTVNVVVGQTTNASVAYALGVGAFTVTINGLPSGVSGAVTVTGPNAFTRLLTATGTITGLMPGAYTVKVDDVDAPAQTYTGTASPASATVTAGQTATSTVTYASTLGQMNVTVSGCGAGDVRVTGPNNFSRQLTASGTLSRLAPGAYTVTSNVVSSGSADNNLICRPVTPSQQVTVSAAGSASVTAAYVAGYVITAQGTGSGAVSLSAPNCSPASMCGVGGFYPTGTTVNVTATATSLARVVSVGGSNAGACSFAPAASDLSLTYTCAVSATATRTISATFALLPPASIEKASRDSVTFKSSAGTFICCSNARVRNARGTPLPNATVTWTSPGNPNVFTNVTDATGVTGQVGLTFNGNPAAGNHNLIATVTTGNGETRSVTFTYVVVAGAVVGGQAVPTIGATNPRPASAPQP